MIYIVNDILIFDKLECYIKDFVTFDQYKFFIKFKFSQRHVRHQVNKDSNHWDEHMAILRCCLAAFMGRPLHRF